jgi:hypothetical protein
MQILSHISTKAQIEDTEAQRVIERNIQEKFFRYLRLHVIIHFPYIDPCRPDLDSSERLDDL